MAILAKMGHGTYLLLINCVFRPVEASWCVKIEFIDFFG